jgi:hypothetical protein
MVDTWKDTPPLLLSTRPPQPGSAREPSTVPSTTFEGISSLLPVSEAWSYSVCFDSYSGGCLASTSCNHYDDYGNWTGSVHIEYQCP